MLRILIFITLTTLSAGSFAKDDPIYTGFFSNLAVGGYDVVSYFKVDKPLKGAKSFATEYMGAEFRFVSADNLALFQANPAQYAPQYGGYCAWAVSQGYTASGDPEVWKIVEGNLYLNYNESVKEDWEQDIPGFIKAGNNNWPAVLE